MYTQSSTRRHRTAVLLAIDGAGAMAEEIRFRGLTSTKAEAVATITNGLLFELIERARRSDGIRDYYDIAVVGYSGDDEVIWQQLPKSDLRMQQLPFAAKNAEASGAGDAFLLDGKFTATVGRESVEIDAAKMRIPGLHNAYNALAAALAALQKLKSGDKQK